jgi:hypothetical protein
LQPPLWNQPVTKLEIMLQRALSDIHNLVGSYGRDGDQRGNL